MRTTAGHSVESQVLQPGTRIGLYEIVSHIAVGGMAHVYKVRHTVLDRYEAMKIPVASLASDPVGMKRFFREARLSAVLQHPNIVVVHAVSDTLMDAQGQDPHPSFFTMELVEGTDLSRLLRDRGPLRPEQALPILRGIAEALDYAHSRSAPIIHRDVKPGNVLLQAVPGLQDTYIPKLTDFGIARGGAPNTGEQALTKVGAILGTPAYLSPEQVRLEPLGPRSDQYALAVIAYEMLSGHTPFKGDDLSVAISHRDNTPTPLVDVGPPAVTSSINIVLQKALAKQPGLRYTTCREFVDALEKATSAADHLLKPESPGDCPTDKGNETPARRTGRVAILVAALCCVVLTGLAVTKMRSTDARQEWASGFAVYVDAMIHPHRRTASAPTVAASPPMGTPITIPAERPATMIPEDAAQSAAGPPRTATSPRPAATTGHPAFRPDPRDGIQIVLAPERINTVFSAIAGSADRARAEALRAGRSLGYRLATRNLEDSPGAMEEKLEESAARVLNAQYGPKRLRVLRQGESLDYGSFRDAFALSAPSSNLAEEVKDAVNAGRQKRADQLAARSALSVRGEAATPPVSPTESQGPAMPTAGADPTPTPIPAEDDISLPKGGDASNSDSPPVVSDSHGRSL